MILALVILAGMWVLVLVPPFLKNRATPLAGNSVEHFQRQLSVLERTGSGGMAPDGKISPLRASQTPVIGRTRAVDHTVSHIHAQSQVRGQSRVATGRHAAREAAKQRRRVVLYSLVAAVVVTFALWVNSGGVFLVLNVAADVLLVTFIGLLIRSQRLQAEREMKVAFLPHQDAGAEPTVLLRQTING